MAKAIRVNAWVAARLKGYTSRMLRAEFASLRSAAQMSGQPSTLVLSLEKRFIFFFGFMRLENDNQLFNGFRCNSPQFVAKEFYSLIRWPGVAAILLVSVIPNAFLSSSMSFGSPRYERLDGLNSGSGMTDSA